MSKLENISKNISNIKPKLQKGVEFNSVGIEPSVKFDVEDTLYNTFKKTALQNLNKVCIRHNDTELTYAEVLEMVDNFAASLSLKNIGVDDIVALPIKNCIETAICLLAINKIGAISKWMDTDKSTREFYDEFAQTDFKYLISDSSIKDKIEEAAKLSGYGSERILYVDSSNFDKNSEFVKVVEEGKNYSIEPVSYVPNKPAIIITSSGSTGRPKEILHSAFSINCAVRKLTYTDYPIKGNILTVVIPPYIGLGLITSLYSSMICCGEAEIISDYTNPFAYVEFIKKNEERFKNLNGQKVLFFGAPMYYKTLLLKKDIISDLSFVGTMMAAGSKMDEALLEEMDRTFAELGCEVPVCNAYGQNEQAGGTTYNTNRANKRGTAGKVAYGTRIMIVNPNTKKELPIGEDGKVLEQSDTHFLGYGNNPEAQRASIFIDEDGEVWFDTKDVGHFDSEEFLHILGRESRSITRFDNKVSLAKIEDKLEKNHIEAIVVKVNAPGPIGIDEAAFVFVISDSNKEKLSYEAMIELIQQSEYPFTPLEMPVWMEYISQNAVPHKNGKINYEELEKVAQQITDEIVASQLQMPKESSAQKKLKPKNDSNKND